MDKSDTIWKKTFAGMKRIKQKEEQLREELVQKGKLVSKIDSHLADCQSSVHILNGQIDIFPEVKKTKRKKNWDDDVTQSATPIATEMTVTKLREKFQNSLQKSNKAFGDGIRSFQNMNKGLEGIGTELRTDMEQTAKKKLRVEQQLRKWEEEVSHFSKELDNDDGVDSDKQGK